MFVSTDLRLKRRPDQISGEEPRFFKCRFGYVHLCLQSLLFVLIVSVIFKDVVAVEQHISFPHYSPHILSLNDYQEFNTCPAPSLNFSYLHKLVQSKMLLIGIVGLLGAAVSAYPQTEVIHTDAVARSGRRFVSEFLDNSIC